MISAPTFQALATTFNRLNLHPVVVFPGDKYQQQPLETVGDRVSATTSIMNDQQTVHAGNAIKHFLYQQFRIIDKEYAKFLDLICYTQPTQEQLDRRHLIVWLDSKLVPAGTAYVGLSRVRQRGKILFPQPPYSHQLTPVRV